MQLLHEGSVCTQVGQELYNNMMMHSYCNDLFLAAAKTANPKLQLRIPFVAD